MNIWFCSGFHCYLFILMRKICSRFVYVCDGPPSADLIKGKRNMLIKTDGIVFPFTSHHAKKNTSEHFHCNWQEIKIHFIKHKVH